MRKRILEKSAVVLLGLLIMLLILPMARPTSSQEPPTQDTAIDSAKLRSFARVYVQLEKIRETYVARLKSAQSVRETDEIEKEARARIAEALKKEGLTPESYSQIVKQFNVDGELRAKAIQLIDEERKKS
jgi:hypothetical protein